MFCPDCGQEASEQVNFCPHCCRTINLITQDSSTIYETEATHLPGVKFAGFWRRFVAFCVIDFILYYTFVKSTGTIVELILRTKEGILVIIVYLVIPWLYFASMEASPKQATLGKMALGIKVTDIKGEPITFVRATARYFGKFLLLIILVIGSERHINFQGFGSRSDIICPLICFIGFSMAVLTPQKQTIYDIIAGTLVLKKETPLQKSNLG